MPYLVCLSNRLNTTNGGSPTDNLYRVSLGCDDDSASGTAHSQARSGGYSKHGQRTGLKVERLG